MAQRREREQARYGPASEEVRVARMIAQSAVEVDSALDAGAGLPAASGVNSLTLNGSFAIADCFNTRNQANILLSAFKASVGTTAGNRASARRVPMSQLHSVLRHLGVK